MTQNLSRWKDLTTLIKERSPHSPHNQLNTIPGTLHSLSTNIPKQTKASISPFSLLPPKITRPHDPSMLRALSLNKAQDFPRVVHPRTFLGVIVCSLCQCQRSVHARPGNWNRWRTWRASRGLRKQSVRK